MRASPALLLMAGHLTWTFGFDTVYAMADRRRPKTGLRSSASAWADMPQPPCRSPRYLPIALALQRSVPEPLSLHP